MNQLPEQIKQQILKEADSYGFVVPYDGSNKFYIDDKVNGYKDGATAYAEQAQKLADALKEFISMHETGLLPNRFTYLKGKEALADWEKGGGV